MRHPGPAQKRKQPRSVDGQQPGRSKQLCGNIGDGNGQQAAGRRNRDQLAELAGQDSDILHLHRASVEASRTVERGNEIGRHRPQHSGGHDDESRIEMRDRAESEYRGGSQQWRSYEQRQRQHRNEPQINPQHRGVEPGGSAIAVGTRFETEEPVYRADLQAGIRNEDEISDGVNGKPRSQRIAGPVMQENRNQRDLLGDSQDHLNQICRPPCKQPPCPP